MRYTRTAMRRLSRAAIAIAALSPSAFTCPTCREALARGDARWAHGLSLSIVFLLTALLAIVGTFSFAVWRSTRAPR
jgi:hypothetical protein